MHSEIQALAYMVVRQTCVCNEQLQGLPLACLIYLFVLILGGV